MFYSDYRNFLNGILKSVNLPTDDLSLTRMYIDALQTESNLNSFASKYGCNMIDAGRVVSNLTKYKIFDFILYANCKIARPYAIKDLFGDNESEVFMAEQIFAAMSVVEKCGLNATYSDYCAYCCETNIASIKKEQYDDLKKCMYMFNLKKRDIVEKDERDNMLYRFMAADLAPRKKYKKKLVLIFPSLDLVEKLHKKWGEILENIIIVSDVNDADVCYKKEDDEKVKVITIESFFNHHEKILMLATNILILPGKNESRTKKIQNLIFELRGKGQVHFCV